MSRTYDKDMKPPEKTVSEKKYSSDITPERGKTLCKMNPQPSQATPSIKDLVHSVINEIEAQTNGTVLGLQTGFSQIDRLTGGLRSGEMFVIGARPSIGKTSLSANIVEHVALDSKLPVGVITLELSADTYVRRMLCARARVSFRDLAEGFIAERDFPRLTGAAGRLANAPLYVESTGRICMFDLREKAVTMHSQHGIKLLVVDYLQLIRADPDSPCDNREQEVTLIAQGIKAIAMDLAIPVIALSQLNRDIEKADLRRKPRLFDLRESGAIEDVADLVGLLYKPEIRDEEWNPDFDPVNLIIAKQRNGSTGEIRLNFFKRVGRFEELNEEASQNEPPSHGPVLTRADLEAAWNKILTADFANASAVVGFEHGTLFVQADNEPVFRGLIRDRVEILGRLQQMLGASGALVNRISLQRPGS